MDCHNIARLYVDAEQIRKCPEVVSALRKAIEVLGKLNVESHRLVHLAAA